MTFFSILVAMIGIEHKTRWIGSPCDAVFTVLYVGEHFFWQVKVITHNWCIGRGGVNEEVTTSTGQKKCPRLVA
jgi:hypothetical protein